MSILDIFTPDAFNVHTLTDTIIKVPFVPGRAGQLVNWNARGVATTSIDIEEKQGVLHLINPTPRGGPGSNLAKQKSTLRTLKIPHYQIDDAMLAEEVQGVRAFGTENQTYTVTQKVNERLAEHVMFNHDPTLEYQRIGALKGIILNADGSVLYNLYNEFGVTAPTPVAFVFNPTTSNGSLRSQFATVADMIADELGGVSYSGISAFYGKNAWKAFIASKEVRELYLASVNAVKLGAGIDYRSSTFEFADISHERYRGQVNGTPFIGDDEIRFFVTGAPGLFRTVFAPADYMETVNTIGLARYAKMWPMADDKGMYMQSQMNALSYCLRPKTLIQGTYTLS